MNGQGNEDSPLSAQEARIAISLDVQINQNSFYFFIDQMNSTKYLLWQIIIFKWRFIMIQGIDFEQLSVQIIMKQNIIKMDVSFNIRIYSETAFFSEGNQFLLKPFALLLYKNH